MAGVGESDLVSTVLVDESLKASGSLFVESDGLVVGFSIAVVEVRHEISRGEARFDEI